MDKISVLTYEGYVEACVYRDLAKDPRTRHLSDGQFADVARNVLKIGGENLRLKSNGTFVGGDWGGSSPSDFLTELMEDETKHYLFTDLSKQDENDDNADKFGGLSEDEFNKLPARKKLEIANRANARG